MSASGCNDAMSIDLGITDKFSKQASLKIQNLRIVRMDLQCLGVVPGGVASVADIGQMFLEELHSTFVPGPLGSDGLGGSFLAAQGLCSKRNISWGSAPQQVEARPSAGLTLIFKVQNIRGRSVWTVQRTAPCNLVLFEELLIILHSISI